MRLTVGKTIADSMNTLHMYTLHINSLGDYAMSQVVFSFFLPELCNSIELWQSVQQNMLPCSLQAKFELSEL